MNTVAKKIRIYGIVQGVGFRPTVSRHAAKTGVTGYVINRGPYVEIFACGSEQQIEDFLWLLRHRPPKRAAILKTDIKPCEPPDTDFRGFTIEESEKTDGEIFISPDIAICDECKEELFDPKNRRFLHPFINCTCCGPRMTILESLPYDRPRTSMKKFPMCPECDAEYHDPKDRRYDAQPVCCNDCGPEVYLLGRAERGPEAITEARKTIAGGGIVAIKGIGGFHLCCDATNGEAVRLLRERKHRPAKPFAVMARNIEAVKAECEVLPEQEEVLCGHQKPIVLLRRKPGQGIVAKSVAPDNPKIGVMLPYAPVQLLIFDYNDGIAIPDFLVMTSGNVSGAPICRDDREAERELTPFTDCILSHNRDIRIRADDSVMDFFEGKPYMIRRSRGFAPLPFMISGESAAEEDRQILAIGGELKNSFCIGKGNLFYLSPYIGDLEDIRTVRALRESVGRFESLLEVEPGFALCDMHPKYNSVAVAKETGLPLIKVQHHYAHVLSCMAENDVREPVIGVSFDGTGYGTDGTIWGGEILIADYAGFERFGSIKPFMQAGGDASAKEGWRIAVGMIGAIYGEKDKAPGVVQRLKICDEENAKTVLAMQEKNINCIKSTSAGRLFDAVSAILGIRLASTFEGEASMALQFAAEEAGKCKASSADKDKFFLKETDGRIILPTDVLVRNIIEERLSGGDARMLARYFHESLAQMIADACAEASKKTGIKKAALSGGCYQNTLLLRLTVERLREQGITPVLHSLVPPNDGGIALGQAVAMLKEPKN